MDLIRHSYWLVTGLIGWHYTRQVGRLKSTDANGFDPSHMFVRLDSLEQHVWTYCGILADITSHIKRNMITMARTDGATHGTLLRLSDTTPRWVSISDHGVGRVLVGGVPEVGCKECTTITRTNWMFYYTVRPRKKETLFLKTIFSQTYN